jgi:hypothetical protein
MQVVLIDKLSNLFQSARNFFFPNCGDLRF